MGGPEHSHEGLSLSLFLSLLPLFRSFSHPLLLSLPLLPFNVPGLSSQLSRRWAVEMIWGGLFLVWGGIFLLPPPLFTFVAQGHFVVYEMQELHMSTSTNQQQQQENRRKRGEEEGMDGERERERKEDG